MNWLSTGRGSLACVPSATFLRCCFLLASMVLHADARAVDDAECTTLQAVAKSTDGFASLRDQAVSPTNWKARARLPSFPDCDIEDQNGDEILNCRGPLVSVEKPATILVPALQFAIGCLGPEWSRQRASTSAGSDWASSVFSKAGSSVEVEVMLVREPQVSQANAIGLPGERAYLWRTGLRAISRAKAGASLLVPLWQRSPEQFCVALKGVMRSGMQQFESVKGEKQDDRWPARGALPGMADCVVHQLDATSSYYSCVVATLPNRGELMGMQTQLVKQVMSCLPANWEDERRPRGEGLWSHSLSNEDEKISLSIRTRGARNKQFEVIIDVNADTE